MRAGVQTRNKKEGNFSIQIKVYVFQHTQLYKYINNMITIIKTQL